MQMDLFQVDAEIPAVARPYSSRKSHGIHYTPSRLARFVARRALSGLGGSALTRELVVLDPACGDGELLLAVAAEAEAAGRSSPHLVGVDRDEEAILAAQERLTGVAAASVVVEKRDFRALGIEKASYLPSSYDLVISNPPYVRTQVLGRQARPGPGATVRARWPRGSLPRVCCGDDRQSL